MPLKVEKEYKKNEEAIKDFDDLVKNKKKVMLLLGETHTNQFADLARTNATIASLSLQEIEIAEGLEVSLTDESDDDGGLDDDSFSNLEFLLILQFRKQSQKLIAEINESKEKLAGATSKLNTMIQQARGTELSYEKLEEIVKLLAKYPYGEKTEKPNPVFAAAVEGPTPKNNLYHLESPDNKGGFFDKFEKADKKNKKLCSELMTKRNQDMIKNLPAFLNPRKNVPAIVLFFGAAHLYYLKDHYTVGSFDMGGSMVQLLFQIKDKGFPAGFRLYSKKYERTVIVPPKELDEYIAKAFTKYAPKI